MPAFSNEWYPRSMYIKGTKEYEHHRATYGEKFGYKDFIPMFKAEKWDPEKWAELFQTEGSQYVVPVAEHHDGFQMYKSAISHWNSCEMGPHRDVLGELKESCLKRGMKVGASSHRIEHWFFMGHGEFGALEKGDLYWPAMPEGDLQDIHSKPEPTEEYLQDWYDRTIEIIDSYHPSILYFDWWIQHESVKPYLRKIAAYYYNCAAEWAESGEMEEPGVVINYKHDAFLFGTAVPDVERGQFADVKPYIWQTDTAIALNSWCYTENNQFRTPQEIVCDLVDIVSKNGRLLLNVGPKADGTISDEDRHVLEGIGDWLKNNGEAIYGSQPYRVYGEGPTQIVEGQFSDGIKKNFTGKDFRFTIANGFIYAIALKSKAANEEYCIETFGRKDASRKANFAGIIDNVELLGSNEQVTWERREDGLHCKVNAESDYPMFFKLTLR